MTDSKRFRSPRIRRWVAVGCTILLIGVLPAPAAAESQVATTTQSFDFDNGNALLEVIFPAIRPARVVISPTGGDATVIIYLSMLLQASWFDSIAPYHRTAVGFHSRLGRRPASEATNRNRNTALIYASYRILNSHLPQFSAAWRNMLTSVGLDPDDNQENTRTAIGLGNLAARRVIESRHHDGMNWKGDEGGRKYNLRPFADYTGYQPVNTAYELRNPSRWQPDIVSSGNGLFQVQQFVTPQMGRTDAFTFDDPAAFPIATPIDSNHLRRQAYKRQADEVLAASAHLTDRQKMTAELFNNKFVSLAEVPGAAAVQAGNMDLEKVVHYLSTTEIALFDVGIVVWYNKLRFDTVRPFSAIRYLYGDQRITAWGGPGKGTVNDITGNEWRSYLGTADHPEYPSGSSGFCLAYAQAARLFLGRDQIENLGITLPAGSSVIEPGITPASDITLSWNTWTDWASDCGMSRLWGGVHFLAAIKNANSFAPRVGSLAYEFVQRHINGNV